MIKVYSMNNCKYCEEAKKYLMEQDIPFEEINLSDKKNSEARKYWRSLGVKIAPIITSIPEKGGNQWIICGFDEEKKCQLENILKEYHE